MICILLSEGIEIKQAKEDWEFQAIHKLNYDTFVEEIPQHHSNSKKTLIDRFNNENIYMIALKNKNVIGMIALRDKRPFSLDEKVKNLDAYLPKYRKICEVRLLSVKKQFRKTKVLYGLVKQAFQYAILEDYDIVVISGILNQQKLYKHMGFIPFGKVVGTEGAQYQPMYMTREGFKVQSILEQQEEVSFLPGPVEISEDVRKAFSIRPLSHRNANFKKMFNETKASLCSLVNARSVEIFSGSGTLANDVISLELSKLNRRGLILSNGEFGDRLIEHGNKNNLDFITYSVPWGKEFDWEHVCELIKNLNIEWIYMAYSETSTGMINDYKKILSFTLENKVKICLDAISAIGNISVDLSKIYLASGVSGKGLAAYCGLSMVFYNHTVEKAEIKISRSLDLYKYIYSQGIPYTLSSNLVSALHCALKNLNIEEKVIRIDEFYRYLKKNIVEVGMAPLEIGQAINPSVLTIPIEGKYDSKEIGDYLRQTGYLVSYESRYLLERNWIQICLMGNIQKHHLDNLVKILVSGEMGK